MTERKRFQRVLVNDAAYWQSPKSMAIPNWKAHLEQQGVEVKTIQPIILEMPGGVKVAPRFDFTQKEKAA